MKNGEVKIKDDVSDKGAKKITLIKLHIKKVFSVACNRLS